MDEDVRRCITVVRLLALRAQQRAGGPPRLAQLARALELAPSQVDATSTAGSAVGAAVVKEDVIDGEWRGGRKSAVE